MTPAMLTAIGRTLAATEYMREDDHPARLYLGFTWPTGTPPRWR
jgi:hypothetical protein